MPKDLNRDKIAKALMLLSAFLFGLLIPGRFSVTTTPSLVHRIYLISRISDAREIRKDSYVLFTMRNNYMSKGQAVDVMGKVPPHQKHKDGPMSAATPVMKIARCLPAEHLKVSDRMYYCNGEYLGRAKKYSLRGEKVDNFVFDDAVPPGKIFVMGEHRDSLDSRYFGFIEATDVIAIGHPVY
jgi:signal peptidase I/conjugal transfer pilin signal peptidase TrbI